ncbi:hypothetical protein EDC50_1056 [Vulcaniibacterium tengchongense]|uniref:Uncharacterized protein n=2 Tax=Vulcaniibacterium tengchongense TaxID=1273429 RepID=A0A3N4W9C9_9GAMM|nr:hypothetical protein EDC50_1056 [Vulcaniibacterium tengchongense]
MVTAGMVSTTDVMFTISGGGVIDIGELVAMPAVEIDIEPNWVVDDIDPTESRRTLASQVSSVRRQAYRRFEAALSADAVAKVRAGGLANGADWGIVRAALLGDRRGAVIPRWKHPDGGIDAAELNRTAIYGIGRLAKVRHLGGDQYGSDIAFEEVPAIP